MSNCFQLKLLIQNRRNVYFDNRFFCHTRRCEKHSMINRWGPRGFGDLGRLAIYFQGAGGALVIILGELGNKLIILGIQGALPKSKKNKK